MNDELDLGLTETTTDEGGELELDLPENDVWDWTVLRLWPEAE